MLNVATAESHEKSSGWPQLLLSSGRSAEPRTNIHMQMMFQVTATTEYRGMVLISIRNPDERQMFPFSELIYP